MKSFDFRNKDTFLRNQFYTAGKFDMPVIYRQEIEPEQVRLLGFQNTRLRDRKNADKTVHFFMDDYKFERVYLYPQKAVSRLAQYRYVLTPDFSLYTNMPRALQIYNTFKRRWCGAFWQAKGMKVIPSVGWGDENSFDFCFDGIEPGSLVAISTLGAKSVRDAYLRGYKEMLRRLRPSAILCYCRPFPEFRRDVIYLPHEAEAAVRLKAQAISESRKEGR